MITGAAGIDMEFVQDNQSSSKKGVLRGLHFQINYPQDKLGRVVSGKCLTSRSISVRGRDIRKNGSCGSVGRRE